MDRGWDDHRSRPRLQAAMMVMTDEELVTEIEAQRDRMIAVATGESRIDAVNIEYVRRRVLIAAELHRRRIVDPNPFVDLWGWWRRLSAGGLPTTESRREFVTQLYQPLLDSLRGTRPVTDEPD